MRGLMPGVHDVTRRLAILTVLLAAGCGELETPDLAHGEVVGLLAGAVPGAFAYPLGAPARKVAVDPVTGQFALLDLPVGTTRLVLFDGALRAELVEVAVTGSQRSAVTRSAADMPLAGRVIMTVVPEGGAVPVAPRFAVKGTDLAGVVGSGGGAVLFPLPAGDWELDTDLAGFQASAEPLPVTAPVAASDAAFVEVRLAVATSGLLGCAAVGDLCRNDLRCDGGDGHCYQCRLDHDDCGPGSSCDPATRFCTVAVGGATAPVCGVCTDDASCGDAASGAYCEKDPLAVTGFCSRRADCPAGFSLDTGGAAGPRCLPLLTCHDYFEEFGERCFGDATCGERDGILGGFCHGADPDLGVAGFCTAPCTSDAGCIVSGFSCDTSQGLPGFCVRAAP